VKDMAVIMVTQQGYYMKFELPPDIALPVSVKAVLQKLWGKKYKDLYEKEGEDLEDAFEELFNIMSPKGDSLGHLRCVYLTWTLALAARPMVLAYLPNDERPDVVLNLIEQWITNPESVIVKDYQDLFKELGHVEYPQALDEALLVYRDLLKMIIPSVEYRSVVLEILDTCFRGYAIFPPPPDGTRDLFNWFLVEVVPAAYCCQLPQKIYTKDWQWPPEKIA
jgi:hypothetical protein